MKISEILKGKESIDSGGSSKVTVIGNNSQFNGSITFTGILKVSGTIKGNIETTEDADAQVILDQNGLIEGDVTAPNVRLKGEVNGNVHSSTHVEIDASALVTGNVYYDILEMHGGSTVNGSLIRNMGKTAGLLEKKAKKEKDDQKSEEKTNTSSFLQSIDKQDKS
jgi:cytoskeletal protein CcmA (bactofilin family)